ncbi:MAG: prolyl oligopeptidase family serine peptidase, partial [Verrucomicrobiales bacterium]|nr:prolyl oligopeptidase family serine peptidase [Verrucomicrobiales bacterium]
YEEFRQLALAEMKDKDKAFHKTAESARKGMKTAQRDALPPRKQVLFQAEVFDIDGSRAFLMKPENPAPGNPWVFYAPTLKSSPDKAESWMHQSFLKAGIAVAGVDVGEAYGSPLALPKFDRLYNEMVEQNYSKKPVLLGRSRGGLWVSSWAVKNPDKVAAIAGIYPVYDVTAYPGLKRAAPAYDMTADELAAKLAEVNPIENAEILAKESIPVFIIHGVEDKVVPINKNSARLEKIYQENGAGDLIELQKIEGQGHNYWPGFFLSQDLVDFVEQHAISPR